MEVHGQLGHGFLEPVYQEALAVELAQRGISAQREVAIPVRYKGVTLSCAYRADFVCFDEILIELKALERLTSREYAQVLNYLKATGLKRGLLLNFGTLRLQYERIVLGYEG